MDNPFGRVLGALCAAGIIGYALAADATVRAGVFTAVCVIAALGCWSGPRRSNSHATAWTAFGVGFVVLAGAQALQLLAPDAAGIWVVPLRAVATLLIALAVWELSRDAVARGRQGYLDPAIAGVGAAIVAWIVILDPIVEQGELDWVERTVALAGPLLDLALVIITCRMLLGAAGRTAPFRLMVAGVALVVAGDGADSITALERFGAGRVAPALWMGGVALIALAATSSALDGFDARTTDRHAAVSSTRLVMLGIAAIAGPIALIVRTAQGATVDLEIVVGGIVALFVLIVVRMGGLVRELGGLAQSHAEATSRERLLRRAAHALVAATDRQTIASTTADAGAALVRDRVGAEVRLFLGDGDTLALAAARGGRAGGSGVLAIADIPPAAQTLLQSGDSDVLTLGPAELRGRLATSVGATAAHSVCLLVPLIVDLEVAGIMSVVLERLPGESRRQAIETVASQAALAIETAALTDEVHARAGEERFRSLVQNASDVIAIIDPGGLIRFVTRSVTAMLGFSPEQLEGISMSRLLHPDDAKSGPGALVDGRSIDWRLRDIHGRYRQVEAIVADQTNDPNVAGIVLTMRDVTDRRALEARLSHQAFHDTLTGLANRALFEDRLGQALARQARTHSGAVAVIFIDLDEFKSINDTLGHQAGDELLRGAAKRLVECLRPTDTAARLGGDEFAIALEIAEFDVDHVITGVAERILAALRTPFIVDGDEVFTRGSLGIASTPDAGVTVGDLLRNADIAMYTAKHSGKGVFRRFEAGMHTPVIRQMELRSELQRAIERNELVLHYQPIVRMEDGRVDGVEALVRWNHPHHGLVPPVEFIPLAEESGLIGIMGRWILAEACRQFVAWMAEAPEAEGRYISINLSGKQLHHGDFVADLQRVIRQTGIAPSAILLELTESVLVDDTERTLERLNALRATGVRIAVDDFGTGFSALAYLQRLPVHVLKLAAPWVQGLRTGQEPLVDTILRLAETLNLDVIAEGIEHAYEVETLARLGCGLGQGFYFSRPLLAEQAGDVLARGAVPTRQPAGVTG